MKQFDIRISLLKSGIFLLVRIYLLLILVCDNSVTTDSSNAPDRTATIEFLNGSWYEATNGIKKNIDGKIVEESESYTPDSTWGFSVIQGNTITSWYRVVCDFVISEHNFTIEGSVIIFGGKNKRTLEVIDNNTIKLVANISDNSSEWFVLKRYNRTPVPPEGWPCE